MSHESSRSRSGNQQTTARRFAPLRAPIVSSWSTGRPWTRMRSPSRPNATLLNATKIALSGAGGGNRAPLVPRGVTSTDISPPERRVVVSLCPRTY